MKYPHPGRGAPSPWRQLTPAHHSSPRGPAIFQYQGDWHRSTISQSTPTICHLLFLTPADSLMLTLTLKNSALMFLFSYALGLLLFVLSWPPPFTMHARLWSRQHSALHESRMGPRLCPPAVWGMDWGQG